ncbi:hypothetical protein FRX31_029510 [Thalictrum thalictroides]|uniref:Uncharacterized protein n=1 Tax=Thalictrum thalictroides TaxID=46969 RepID=A0A7J6V6Z9_THATH|nr:hypothetical protein FRX31_029510 [Thalictrum thalictroides]
MAPTNNNEFLKKNLDAAINGLKDELKADFKEDLKFQLQALTKLIKDSLTPQQPSTDSSNITHQNSFITNAFATLKTPTTLTENIIAALPITTNLSIEFLNQPYNTN